MTRLSPAALKAAALKASRSARLASIFNAASATPNAAGRTSTLRADGSIVNAPSTVGRGGAVAPHVGPALKCALSGGHWNASTQQCDAGPQRAYLAGAPPGAGGGGVAGVPNAVAGGPGSSCDYMRWCDGGSTCSDSVNGGTCIADTPPPGGGTGGTGGSGYGVPDGGPCLDNWNCASNACNSFTCLPSSGGCLVSGQCASGEECSGGNCIPATPFNWCINNGNCGGTDVCVNGTCEPDNGTGGGGGCLADGTCVCQDAYGNDGFLDKDSNCVATACGAGQGRGAISNVCMDCESNGFQADGVHCEICPAGFKYDAGNDECVDQGGGGPPVIPVTKQPPPVQCAPGFTPVSGSAGISCGKPKDPPKGTTDPPVTTKPVKPAAAGDSSNGMLYGVLALGALAVAAVVMTGGKKSGSKKSSSKRRR